MWRVKKYLVVPESHEHGINEDKDIGLSHVQSALRKRKCCAGSRIGPCFQTVTSSPPPPFSWGEKPERERLTGRGGGESQHPDIYSLTETFTLQLLYMRKKPIQKSVHTHTKKQRYEHRPPSLTFTDSIFSLILSSNSFIDEIKSIKIIVV